MYTDPDGKTHQAKLTASAPGTYEAQLDTAASGVYNLSVQRKNGKKIENALTTAAVVQYSQEYKFALTNDSFLCVHQTVWKDAFPKEECMEEVKSFRAGTGLSDQSAFNPFCFSYFWQISPCGGLPMFHQCHTGRDRQKKL